MAEHFVETLERAAAYREGRLEDALRETFVALDRRLLKKRDADEQELMGYNTFCEPEIPIEDKNYISFAPSAAPKQCADCSCYKKVEALFHDLTLPTLPDQPTRRFQSEPSFGGNAIGPSDLPPKYDSCLSSLEATPGDGSMSRRKRFTRKFRPRRKRSVERTLSLSASKSDDSQGLWSQVRQTLNRRKSSNSPRNSRGPPEGCPSARVAGCTAVVAILTNTRLVVANAGDSRCILGRSTGAVHLTRDHKPQNDVEKVGEVVESLQARIEAAGGSVEFGRVNGNLNLSRAIGDLHYKQDPSRPLEDQIITSHPDVTSVDLSPQDEFICLACDGLFEFFSSEDVYKHIASNVVSSDVKCELGGGPTTAHIVMNEVSELPDDATRMAVVMERLFNAILSPNPTFVDYGCDNMTAVIVDLRPFRDCSCDCHVTNRH